MCLIDLHIYCTLYFCKGLAIPLQLPPPAFVCFEIHSKRAKKCHLMCRICSNFWNQLFFYRLSFYRLKDQNLIKDNKPKDILESSSDSEEKIPAVKPLSVPKRKLELEGETVEKKKKGRPRKDSRLVPVTLTVQVKYEIHCGFQSSSNEVSPMLTCSIDSGKHKQYQSLRIFSHAHSIPLNLLVLEFKLKKNRCTWCDKCIYISFIEICSYLLKVPAC